MDRSRITIDWHLVEYPGGERLTSDLESSLACGGTAHENATELQGDHRDRIDAVLAENGLQVQ